MHFKLGKVVINERFFNTLMPGNEVNCDIIIAFITICKVEQNSFNPLIFGTWAIESIKNDKSRIYHYSNMHNGCSKKMWIIATGINHHYSLIIIVFKMKVIIYIYSLHSDSNKNDLKEICSFIDTMYYSNN